VWILSVLLWLAAGSALAEDRTQGVVVWGIGQINCGRFVQERERRPGVRGPYDATFRQWFLGFATALNWIMLSNRDLLASTDAEGAMTWLEDYCRAKPDDTFFDAAVALQHEFSTRAGRQP
jgi:hypothetical protein